MAHFAPFHHRVARTAGDRTCGRAVISRMHEAEREDAMQQIIVTRNNKEEVPGENPQF
jgi:hypothetical protein